MAGLPAQTFTLSEIVKLTGTNVASCHAILNVLVARGYLLRHQVHKAYRLAPSIVAIGEAAAAHDPLLASARESAASIAANTGLETTLSARAGEDIIGVARFGRSPLGRPSLRIGQRVPMRPPLGALFLAWARHDAVARWIAPDGESTSVAVRAAHEAALALVRKRGFLVTLDSPAHSVFTREIGETSSSAGQASRLSDLIDALDNGLYQPETIEPDHTYPVKVICAPIFDAQGQVLYALNLNFPPGELRGDQLVDIGTRLRNACTSSMQANSINPVATRA